MRHRDELEAILRAAPSLMAVMETARALDLPDWLIFSGAIYQRVLNHLTGRDPDHGIKDYDLAYFDPDTSWDAEDAVIKRVAEAFDEPFRSDVEVRNQARVHLWYPQRFGHPYPQLASARAGIDRYLVECTCVGIEVATGELYAPHGLQALAQGLLRVNPLTPQPQLFAAKAHSYVARWPWLRIEDWADAAAADSPAEIAP